MTTATTETSELFAIEENVIQALPIASIERSFNIRYGWDENAYLDVYGHGIDELVESIKSEGFKVDKPILVYFDRQDDDGNPVYKIEDGQRRYVAASIVAESDPEKPLSKGLDPGEVWVCLGEKPASKSELIIAQRNSNKHQPTTKMDDAKAMAELVSDPELGKTATARQIKIGELFGGYTRQTVLNYLSVYKLPDTIKAWIQATEIGTDNEDFIGLSFSGAMEIAKEYKSDADAILHKVRDNIISCPEKVKTHGKLVQVAYIREIAESLGFGKKPKKNEVVEEPAVLAGVEDSTSESVSTDDSSVQQNGYAVTTDQSWPATTDLVDPQETEGQLPEFLQSPKANVNPGNKNSSSGVTAKSQASDTTSSSASTASASHERVKTRINKLMEEQAGFYIANGVSDMESGEFIVKFPLDLGEQLAELLSAIIDPNSNPLSEAAENIPTSEASVALEDLEF